MIFIFPQWRFGNQIFQYMFAKYIAVGNEKIVTTDAQYFSIINESNKKFTIIPTWSFFKYINFWLNKLFFILGKCRIITHVRQKHIIYDWFLIWAKWYTTSIWLFKSIKYIDWFFVNEDKHIIWKEIQINQKYIKKAQRFLSQIPESYYKIFVHIRKCDYLEWSIMGQADVSLPLDYYIKQIKFFQKKYKNIYFIFLSDDIKSIKKDFLHINNVFFSENDLWTDFAIMTLCDWWVISSSFSYVWWYFCKNKIEVICPKYFLWFKNKYWYPEGIRTEKFNYSEID